MKKIEVKKDSFLKNAKNYAIKKKKAKPVKLPMPPDAISALKVKFPFARVEEIILTPERLWFFRERLGMRVKASATDSDASKTYYVTYLDALLQELAKFGIYTGQTAEDRLTALSAWMEGMKGDKIIIEVIPKAAFAPSSSSVGFEERESGEFTATSGRTLSSLIESPSLDLLTETTRQDVERHRKKIEEQAMLIEGLEASIASYRKVLEQGSLELMEREAATRKVAEALEEAQREIARLKEQGKGKEEAVEGEGGSDGSEGLWERDDEIDRLIEETEAEEAARVPLITEAIRQWVCRLSKSRNERVTVPFYNPGTRQEEFETLPRFAAIARLEAEKAAHFAKNGTDWPKAEVLARMCLEGYEVDLDCLFLYQQEGFPRELRMFAVLFAFWEAAHHHRLYRDAFSIALNSGAIPATMGIAPDTPHADALLKILHSADMMRILMGHYGAIAEKQFDVTLFTFQEETLARYGGSLPDINRTTTEGAMYI